MAEKNINQLSIGSCDVYIDDNFVGYTKDEVTVTFTREQMEFTSGLPQIPVAKIVTKETIGASFSFAQLSAQNFAYALGLTVDPVAVPGHEVINFGGSTALGNQHRLELIHNYPDGRILEVIFWKARPSPEVAIAFSSGEYIGIPTTWLAEEDSSLAAGSRLGRIQVEKESKS